MRGCYQYHKRVSGDKVDNVELDAEQGSYAGAACGETSDTAAKNTECPEGHSVRQPAGTWGYVFQIIFQVYYFQINSNLSLLGVIFSLFHL